MEKDLIETTVTSELIFDGKIVQLYRDTVRLPDGAETFREVVRHLGAVAVLPLTDDGEVIFVKQYRYPFSQVLTEIPAGKLDSPDEDPVEAAMRELREETGVTCEKLTYIGDIYPSVAILDEVIHMYCAQGLSYGQSTPDEGEFLNVLRIPIDEAFEMVLSGEIKDSKTQAAILKVKALRENKKL